MENNSLCKTFEIVGLKDLADSPLFQVFPNPVKDILNLKMEANGIKHIKLIHLNGSLVLESQTSACETNLDLSGFDSGIYLLSITSAKDCYVQKIVKE
ncbi:MAG TPA: T9SS type A sorting domain-containing protein [Prolixibacteraceae bacterium]